MKVKELIEKLQQMDQDVEVWHLYDGALRGNINHVYMGKTGLCVTADHDEVAYYDDARPVNAPSEKDVKHWNTPTEEA